MSRGTSTLTFCSSGRTLPAFIQHFMTISSNSAKCNQAQSSKQALKSETFVKGQPLESFPSPLRLSSFLMRMKRGSLVLRPSWYSPETTSSIWTQYVGTGLHPAVTLSSSPKASVWNAPKGTTPSARASANDRSNNVPNGRHERLRAILLPSLLWLKNFVLLKYYTSISPFCQLHHVSVHSSLLFSHIHPHTLWTVSTLHT